MFRVSILRFFILLVTRCGTFSKVFMYPNFTNKLADIQNWLQKGDNKKRTIERVDAERWLVNVPFGVANVAIAIGFTIKLFFFVFSRIYLVEFFGVPIPSIDILLDSVFTILIMLFGIGYIFVYLSPISSDNVNRTLDASMKAVKLFFAIHIAAILLHILLRLLSLVGLGMTTFWSCKIILTASVCNRWITTWLLVYFVLNIIGLLGLLVCLCVAVVVYFFKPFGPSKMQHGVLLMIHSGGHMDGLNFGKDTYSKVRDIICNVSKNGKANIREEEMKMLPNNDV